MSKIVKRVFDKKPGEVVNLIEEKAEDFNFIVREVFDMAKEFGEHDVDVDDEFVYYSIMLCNPQKAYEGIYASGIRGALLLPPKQVVVYVENGKTVVAYVKQGKEDVTKLLPGDEAFQISLSTSCDKIEKLIDSIN